MPSLPDVSNCKTRYAFVGYWACQVEHPQFCRYALAFGGIFICKHVEKKAFCCDTKEEKNS